MKNIFDLTGKVAAVTGAGGVLCGEMVKALACAGAKVAVIDLSLEAAKKVTDEIKEQGGAAIAIKCNVLNKRQIENTAKKIAATIETLSRTVYGTKKNLILL